VLGIYGEGIETRTATFDTVVPDWRRWQAVHRRECRFVARIRGSIVGWTALGRYSTREVYAGVAWESVYVGEAGRGRGVGGDPIAKPTGVRRADEGVGSSARHRPRQEG